MAEATPSSLSAIEAELFADNLECGVIVLGIVEGEIANVVVDTKVLENPEDFICNVGPRVSASLRQSQNDFVRLAIVIPKKASDAV